MEGESRTEAREHAKFYLRGRGASTIAAYNTEYRKLVQFCVNSGRVYGCWSERDVVSFIIWRAKQGVFENQLKQGLAEVCEFESPAKSPVMAKAMPAELVLGNITWHFGRIGAASEAARKKVGRNEIMKGGGWRSSAVDMYRRVTDAGVRVGDALL